MKRFVQKHLKKWQNNPNRKPLLLRGARQVGKTYTVREFAKENFTHFFEINFELRPELKKIFEKLDAKEIVRNLNLSSGAQIVPGKTLLFLDEIQECPQAISSLRYFHENFPELHVMAAGSLVEFALDAKNLHMPVGRVSYLHMYPMSFGEFICALGHENLYEYLAELTLKTKINEAVHDKLMELFRKFLIVGGMPEVVKIYLQNADSLQFQETQLSLLQTYRNDFGKYASRAEITYLQKIFNTAPSLVGQIYKYSHVDPDTQARELKNALHLLAQANVITKILSTSGHGLPFLKDAQEKKFKIIFLDVGLMQRACGLDGALATTKDFISINSGAVAEQFVGQQLLTCRNPHETPELFFWSRAKKSSQAEVDFLTSWQTHIIPIEVKSGKTGTLKSLKLFLKEHHAPFGIRFSQHPLSYHDQVLSIPLYAVENMFELISNLKF